MKGSSPSCSICFQKEIEKVVIDWFFFKRVPTTLMIALKIICIHKVIHTALNLVPKRRLMVTSSIETSKVLTNKIINI